MKHRLILVVLVAAVCVAAFGCGGGGNEALNNATPAKPQDIGDPNSIATGVTEWKGQFFIVKTDVDGEMRLWVVSKRIRGKDGGMVEWLPEQKMFADSNRNHRYDIGGLALHKVKSPQAGDNAGLPGFRLHRYKVELDPSTGHVMLYNFQSLSVSDEELSDAVTGAYIVVP